MKRLTTRLSEKTVAFVAAKIINSSLVWCACSGWTVALLAIAALLITRWRHTATRNRNAPLPNLEETQQTRREAFRCPISLEVMADPTLVVESGMTYERTEIQKWFRTHNTDPTTNHTLASKKLVPNIALRHAIEARSLIRKRAQVSTQAILQWLSSCL